ncbi:hypothetical protein HMPREF1573_01206, partial [Gardnerella vaginalis JCP7276]
PRRAVYCFRMKQGLKKIAMEANKNCDSRTKSCLNSRVYYFNH